MTLELPCDRKIYSLIIDSINHKVNIILKSRTFKIEELKYFRAVAFEEKQGGDIRKYSS